MHEQLMALLALQTDDAEIHRIESRIRSLDAAVQQLERERAGAASALEEARAAVTGERERQRELEARMQEHRRLQDRGMAHMDAVKKAREAAAAWSEVEMMRRVLASEESDLLAIGGRLDALQQAADLHEMALAELAEQQAGTRQALGAERGALEAELREARATREQMAARVPRPLLAKYERIRARGSTAALVPLRNASCGNCHMAVPLQRRTQIQTGRVIEACEGCGVLLYAAD